MDERFSRTELLIGREGLCRLAEASVIIFGIGGVGSYVAEGLARAGIGHICLVDNDVIDVTNINRQIPALNSTVGKSKVVVMAERIKDINPSCHVETRECFFLPENAHEFEFKGRDYIIDAIDTVSGKLAIIEKAYSDNIPVISSMGTGNKMNPGDFRITTIEKTRVCPLARIMRRKLKEKGIEGVKVLYSEEEPVSSGGRTPGSIAYVPSVAGLLIAGEVIRDLLCDVRDLLGEKL